jgi:hypothetical protein
MSDQSKRERGKQKLEAIAQVPAFDPPDPSAAGAADECGRPPAWVSLRVSVPRTERWPSGRRQRS